MTTRRTRPALAAFLAAAIGLLLAACGSQPSTPTSESGLLNAGLKAESAGRNGEAKQDYLKVLAINPRNKYALYDLGYLAQVVDHDATSAERYYRATLDVDPNFANALFNLAILRTGPSPSEAEQLYRRAIAVQPGWANAHLNLGFLLIAEGKAAEGKSELQTAVRLDPSLAPRVPAQYLAGASSASPQPSP